MPVLIIAGNGSWSSEKKRKRRSRWANDDADKTFIPGMPTSLPADATEDQKQQYLREYISAFTKPLSSSLIFSGY